MAKRRRMKILALNYGVNDIPKISMKCKSKLKEVTSELSSNYWSIQIDNFLVRH